MSVRRTEEEFNELYTEIYPEVKSHGLSDRDADIVTWMKILKRAHCSLAEKHGISQEEVSRIVNDYYAGLRNERISHN